MGEQRKEERIRDGANKIKFHLTYWMYTWKAKGRESKGREREHELQEALS